MCDLSCFVIRITQFRYLFIDMFLYIFELTHSRLIRSQRPDESTGARTGPVAATGRYFGNAAKRQYATYLLPPYTVTVCDQFIYLTCCISHSKLLFGCSFAQLLPITADVASHISCVHVNVKTCLHVFGNHIFDATC